MQRFIFIFYSLLAVCMLFVSGAAAESTLNKVVLLPFDTEKAGKYHVLEDALTTMVAGRLSALKNVILVENILDPEEQGKFLQSYPQNAEEIFRKLDADRIGAGVIEVKDTRLILQMSFFDKQGSGPVVVEAKAENEQLIMRAVDQLLLSINAEVFSDSSPGSPKAPLLTEKGGIDAFQTEHPDRKYKEEIVFGSAVFTDEEGASVARENIRRRTSSLPAGLIGLSLADTDNDGRSEIIAVSQNDIRAYRYDRGILQQIGSAALRRDLKVHAMNIADVDQDGRGEIYISGVRNDDLSSSIYTWDQEEGFREIVARIPWAVRPLEIPGEGMVVLGQKESREEETFLEPGLYPLEIDLSTGKVEAKERLFLPAMFNLFDFVYADLEGDGVWEKVAVTSQLKLAVYDHSNRIIWLSEDDFGGNVVYLGNRWRVKEGKSYANNTHDDENYIELQYIPVRLVARDVNNDGKTDIIAVKNTLATFKVLPNLRSFKGGNAVCLGWNGAKMTELWQTDNLDGYIVDFHFDSISKTLGGVFANDESDRSSDVRLVLGQVPNDGFADVFNFFGGETKLVVYEFRIVKETGETADSN